MQIAILGCGVSGLTTALTLQEKGLKPVIFAAQTPPDTTSNRAAAFWSPYYAYGDRASAWAKYAYGIFEELALAVPQSGVSMTSMYRMRRDSQGKDEYWTASLPDDKWQRLPESALLPGYTSGYQVEVPLIETQLYLPHLLDRYIKNGGLIHRQHINSFEFLLEKGYDLVINCAGLGSRELCQDDQLRPVRGQIAVVNAIPRYPIFLDESIPTHIILRKDGCILGGVREENEAEEKVVPETIADIIRRCVAIDPGLEGAEILTTWAGLRPVRYEVRVEKDAVLPVIHHYGHGGAGFTLSWGSAREAVELAGV